MRLNKVCSCGYWHLKNFEKECPKCHRKNANYELCELLVVKLGEPSIAKKLASMISLEFKKAILNELWEYYQLGGCPHTDKSKWPTEKKWLCKKTNQLYPVKGGIVSLHGDWVDFCPFLKLPLNELIEVLRSMKEKAGA
ncbi:MAG: hypothetical protein GF308_11725 [Candidatus Heimdallarchaeota archaeon]|nr:hypothetical protein [Candidatus Heimdallarchaeota archaeon]